MKLKHSAPNTILTQKGPSMVLAAPMHSHLIDLHGTILDTGAASQVTSKNIREI